LLNDRNYHVFYQLCRGAPGELNMKLRLSAPENYFYLKQGTTSIDGVDDAANFYQLTDALKVSFFFLYIYIYNKQNKFNNKNNSKLESWNWFR